MFDTWCILQLRGIGACGYYRLTTEDDDDDEEDDVEEKKESDADAGDENTEDGKESVLHC